MIKGIDNLLDFSRFLESMAGLGLIGSVPGKVGTPKANTSAGLDPGNILTLAN